MRKKVSRETLLSELEAVQPGLSTRDVIEQSSCYVFMKGKVITYNGEIACMHDTCLGKVRGAVHAAPLLGILKRLNKKKLDVEFTQDELLIHGKSDSAGITFEKEVSLPMDNLEEPEKWHELPMDFAKAVEVAQQCTGKDENKFWTTCVHITPEWIEASDNDQITRYKVETPVKRPMLVRGSSIKQILFYGMTEFAETKTWVHFRNGTGLTLSCLRYIQNFPDLAPYLVVKGKKAKFPDGLKEATERAAIFSAENPDSNRILVELERGKLTLRGEGASGWYSARRETSYTGKALCFMIAPALLADLSKRYKQCTMGKDALKVNGGKFEYVASLGSPDDTEEADEEEDTDE